MVEQSSGNRTDKQKLMAKQGFKKDINQNHLQEVIDTMHGVKKNAEKMVDIFSPMSAKKVELVIEEEAAKGLFGKKKVTKVTVLATLSKHGRVFIDFENLEQGQKFYNLLPLPK